MPETDAEGSAAAVPPDAVPPDTGPPDAEPVLSGLDARPWFVRILPGLGAAAAVALVVALVFPSRFLATVGFSLAALATPVGQEVWLVLGPQRFHLPLVYVAAILAAINLSLCLFFALAFPIQRLMERLPRLGRRIARFEARVQRSRYAQSGLAVALGVVVALPVHSGGAVLGSLAGRALGISWPRTVAAVLGGILVRLGAAFLIVYGWPF
jgi:uncharacterized membrane protein